MYGLGSLTGCLLWPLHGSCTPLLPRRLQSLFVSVFPFRTGKAGLIFTAPEGAVGNRRHLVVLCSVNWEAGNGRDGLKWFPHPPSLCLVPTAPLMGDGVCDRAA